MDELELISPISLTSAETALEWLWLCVVVAVWGAVILARGWLVGACLGWIPAMVAAFPLSLLESRIRVLGDKSRRNRPGAGPL